MKAYSLILLVLLSFAGEVFAAKKDFKGLFGNYRREKFTENESNSTDLGVDILLSTLLPLSPLVKSIESSGGSAGNLNYETFFNFEASFFMSLFYNWQLFANIGYYTYDTRKQNSNTDPAKPQFHQFELEAIPVVLGARYRFSNSDIVPYVGAGAGMAYVRRKGFYDYSTVLFNQEFLNCLVGQVMGGFEFYISGRAGIRLEASAYYMSLPAKTYDTGGTPAVNPIIVYQAKPWSFRYASGVFFLF